MVVVLSGCIQAPQKPAVSKNLSTEEWKADGIIGQHEYSHKIVAMAPSKHGYLGGTLEISWKNDQEYIYIGLNGSSLGWLAIGFEPSAWMKDADIILGQVRNGKATVLDEYSLGNFGPHIEDRLRGGTDDVIESGGRQKDGCTVLEFKRKLNTGDKFDKVLKVGQNVSIIWAMSDNFDPSFKHDVAYSEAISYPRGEDRGYRSISKSARIRTSSVHMGRGKSSSGSLHVPPWINQLDHL
jgi:hypothetical protein